MYAAFVHRRQELVKTWRADTPKERIEQYLNTSLQLNSAAAGTSSIQGNYRTPLLVLAMITGLVLLIACVNVANLLTAQAAARAREMSLRVSIGAGRLRLIQLMLIECALLAAAASVLGGMLARWSAPFVVSMLAPRDNPVRLVLDWDWRVLGFALGLAMAVTFLFGLAPALRASGVKPISALKGGENPHSRRRLMNSLVAAQVTFCFLVLFVAGLFMATFDKLSHQPTGFAHERVLLVETSTGTTRQSAEVWRQVLANLAALPGVESAAISSFPLIGNTSWQENIRVSGRVPDGRNPCFLAVSPGFFETMRIGWIDGRRFRPEDVPADVEEDKTIRPGVAIVNEAFVRQYFNDQNPIGRSFERISRHNMTAPIEIVGYVKDTRYRTIREEFEPIVYVPLSRELWWATFEIRSVAADPAPLASLVRAEISRAHPAFRVSNITTQRELVRNSTIRERLLAILSFFFAAVALILAGIGLYGVLSYSVLQRRREIGIRMALGARAGDLARRVTAEVFGMLFLGSIAGLATGMVSERLVEMLLFEVKGTDAVMLVLPALAILATALVAALPPVLRAVRIDPAETLRAE